MYNDTNTREERCCCELGTRHSTSRAVLWLGLHHACNSSGSPIYRTMVRLTIPPSHPSLHSLCQNCHPSRNPAAMEVALTFGSLGDIIAICEVAVKLGRAIGVGSRAVTGDSAREYQQLREDIDSFVRMLMHVRRRCLPCSHG